jgi:dihydropyrimidinase
LILDVERLSKPGFEGAKFVCSPALRETRHHDELWRALHKGWLQTVGSDHCSFNYKGQKDMGKGDFTKIPNGAPGMENRLAILYTYGVLTGKLPLTRLIDVFATAPAKFFGCYPRKGSITVGADADLVIFDPAYEGKISVKTPRTITMPGASARRNTRAGLSAGRHVDKGRFIGKAAGKFIKREPTVSPIKVCERDRAQRGYR